LLEYLLPRRAVVLSFRGRGLSDTPESGYNLEHHVEDVEAVIREAGLSRFSLYGYSRGVSYALGYARGHSDRITGLILQDYPPEHKAMPSEWPKDYIENYLIPYDRLSQIRPKAVEGIQRESTQQALVYPYESPVLVMRGLLEDSLLPDDELEKYKKNFLNLRVRDFARSGHDIRGMEKMELYETIQAYLNELD